MDKEKKIMEHQFSFDGLALPILFICITIVLIFGQYSHDMKEMQIEKEKTKQLEIQQNLIIKEEY